MQTTYENDLDVLTELSSAGGNLDGAKFHLATSAPAMGPEMLLADFTEATFTGSAAKTLTWGTPFYGPDGVPEVDSQLATFIATVAPVTPEVVLAYYVTDAAGTVLLFADRLDTPVTFGKVSDGVSLGIAYRRYDGALLEE